jgi:SAM-dependent methyltransferase
VPEVEPELWARRASSFGGAARAYADHRPDYAAEAIAWCLAGADGPATDVLDLAAGTGALTAGVLATGAAVTAVEPDPQMLAELRRRLPEVPAAVGRAEAIPLADDSVDAVVVGTAFHWFDDSALPEIARVLRPGGVLAILYNEDDVSIPWVAELGRIARSSVSTPPGEEPEAPPSYPGFGPVELARFPHRHRRTAASLTATIGTHSHTLVISAEERAELLARVRAFLESNPETSGGEFDQPLVTVAGRAVVAAPG